jgi:hypothetical protein
MLVGQVLPERYHLVARVQGNPDRDTYTILNAYGTLSRSYPPITLANLHQHRQVLAHSDGSTLEG